MASKRPVPVSAIYEFVAEIQESAWQSARAGACPEALDYASQAVSQSRVLAKRDPVDGPDELRASIELRDEIKAGCGGSRRTETPMAKQAGISKKQINKAMSILKRVAGSGVTDWSKRGGKKGRKSKSSGGSKDFWNQAKPKTLDCECRSTSKGKYVCKCSGGIKCRAKKGGKRRSRRS